MRIKEIGTLNTTVPYGLPLLLARIAAGFPSPADDHIEKSLDLNEYLVKHPAATFFVRVEGDSMINAGIRSGDILIVDRAAEVKNNSIVIAHLNGEFTVKRIRKEGSGLFLIPESPDFMPIKITDEMDFQLWGVVTFVIHQAQ
jgi:DNA polymerase V